MALERGPDCLTISLLPMFEFVQVGQQTQTEVLAMRVGKIISNY